MNPEGVGMAVNLNPNLAGYGQNMAYILPQSQAGGQWRASIGGKDSWVSGKNGVC